MSIKKVETIIKEKIELYSKDSEIDHLVTGIKNIIDNDYLLPLLEEIGEYEEYTSKVLTNSYFHTNGFLKIVLMENTEYKLRLHIWKPNDKYVSPEHIHNHRWDFATKILAGSYKMELHTKENGNNKYHAYEYFSPEGKDVYHMEKKELEYLKKNLEVYLPENSVYGISYTELHRVVNLEKEKLTATLILQGRARQNSTAVFADEPFQNNENVQLSRLTREEFLESIKLVKNSILGVNRK